MSIDSTLSPEQKLVLVQMECVCRECHKSPTTKRRRSYCASCGKPLAWRTGTTPLPRAEALVKARRDERARCADIVVRYTAYCQPGPVQMAARDMLAAIQSKEKPT